MKDTTYTYHHDAGHGWLEVPFDDLIELDIAKEITPFSYVKKDTVFLEEDQDMSTFFKAYREKFGKKPEYTTEGDGDWIRDLRMYELRDFAIYLQEELYELRKELDAPGLSTGQEVKISSEMFKISQYLK